MPPIKYECWRHTDDSPTANNLTNSTEEIIVRVERPLRNGIVIKSILARTAKHIYTLDTLDKYVPTKCLKRLLISTRIYSKGYF